MPYFFLNMKEAMSQTNPKETISLWSMGRDSLHSDDGPKGLVKDYKMIAADFKESLDGSTDAVQFSIEASNAIFSDVTLHECGKVLNQEIQTMVKTIETVLFFPDNILQEIKQTVTEYAEKYKDYVHAHQLEDDLSIALGVEMQTVENENGDAEVQVDIYVFGQKDYDGFETGLERDEEEEELEEDERFEEKTLYFEMLPNTIG